MAILYISDLHFGHDEVIPHDGRPFRNAAEMDQAMIERWNRKVQPEDHVYIVGDFAFRKEPEPQKYLQKLSGHKHLIIGNHDQQLLQNSCAMTFFESADHLLYLTDEGREVVLCHYPLADWDRLRQGRWLIYGHIHNQKNNVYEYMKTCEHALNAAVCINDYTPATFEELIRNNRRFQEKNETSEKRGAIWGF